MVISSSGGSTGNGGNGGNGGAGTGGAVSNTGSSAIGNATIAANSASGGTGAPGGTGQSTGTNGASGTTTGGGLVNSGSQLRVTNAILSANTGGTTANCSGTITDGGHNLEFNPTTTCGFTIAVQHGDPNLDTLKDNGGPTQTLALLPGSAALDTGDDAACAAPPTSNLDQRSVIRPKGAHCDIGAFEAGFTLISVNPSSGPTAGGNRVTLTGAGFAAGATVTFGGTPATVTNVTPSTITVTAPAHATSQAVDVAVTSGGTTVTLPGAYTYGIVNPLPGQDATGGSPGNPSPLPLVRQSGGSPGNPNPLPPPRP